VQNPPAIPVPPLNGSNQNPPARPVPPVNGNNPREGLRHLKHSAEHGVNGIFNGALAPGPLLPVVAEPPADFHGLIPGPYMFSPIPQLRERLRAVRERAFQERDRLGYGMPNRPTPPQSHENPGAMPHRPRQPVATLPVEGRAPGPDGAASQLKRLRLNDPRPPAGPAASPDKTGNQPASQFDAPLYNFGNPFLDALQADSGLAHAELSTASASQALRPSNRAAPISSSGAGNNGIDPRRIFPGVPAGPEQVQDLQRNIFQYPAQPEFAPPFAPPRNFLALPVMRRPRDEALNIVQAAAQNRPSPHQDGPFALGMNRNQAPNQFVEEGASDGGLGFPFVVLP